MRVLLKLLLGVLVLGIIGLGGAWIWAGRMDGPRIDVRQPQKFVGQAGTLDMMVEAPRGELSHLDATLEQGGKSYPVYARETGERTRTSQQNADQLWISVPIGKKDVPALKSGQATSWRCGSGAGTFHLFKLRWNRWRGAVFPNGWSWTRPASRGLFARCRPKIRSRCPSTSRWSWNCIRANATSYNAGFMQNASQKARRLTG